MRRDGEFTRLQKVPRKAIDFRSYAVIIVVMALDDIHLWLYSFLVQRLLRLFNHGEWEELIAVADENREWDFALGVANVGAVLRLNGACVNRCGGEIFRFKQAHQERKI